MKRKTFYALLWFPILLMTMEASARATEAGLVELEDVSEAEKVKWARATKIDVVDAIRAALTQSSGKVIEAALHSVNGRLVYEVEVVTKEGRVVEILVDPQTGRVIEGSHP